jgi:hypothetical protein
MIHSPPERCEGSAFHKSPRKERFLTRRTPFGMTKREFFPQSVKPRPPEKQELSHRLFSSVLGLSSDQPLLRSVKRKNRDCFATGAARLLSATI